jgi:hypothetical protein
MTQVRQSAFFLRNNILHGGQVAVGQAWRDAALESEAGEPLRLSDLISAATRKGRLLVLAVGSITWPPYRDALAAYRRLAARRAADIEVRWRARNNADPLLSSRNRCAVID